MWIREFLGLFSILLYIILNDKCKNPLKYIKNELKCKNTFKNTNKMSK